jgi:site-specific DNA-cytosine methylase
MKAVGIHTFAGGFGLGLAEKHIIKAQYEIASSSVKGPRASEHRQALYDSMINNYWDIIEQVPPFNIDILKTDIVFGNPPCAPWSNMNTNNGNWRNDQRLSCVNDVISGGLSLDADYILVESVVRSWTSGKEFWNAWSKTLQAQGYAIYIWLHNVNALGGYQDRKRFMFIASKYHLTFPEVLDPGSRPILRDHIHMMDNYHSEITYQPKSFDQTLKLFWLNAKPGPLRKQAPATIKIPFLARKLDLNFAAPTIVGRYLVHPTEGRCLNWDEFRHLLGFPLWWKTGRQQTKSGDVEAGILPMTRGVCPTVGRHIGKIISNSGSKVEDTFLKVVDQR